VFTVMQNLLLPVERGATILTKFFQNYKEELVVFTVNLTVNQKTTKQDQRISSKLIKVL